MSFDIFVIRSENGKVAPIPLEVIEQAFGPFIKYREPAGWELSFPDGGRSFVYIKEDDGKHGFNVNRPASSPELWTALLDILRVPGTVLFWPGGGAVVGDNSLILHLMPAIAEIFGTPIVARDGAEIVKLIERS